MLRLAALSMLLAVLFAQPVRAQLCQDTQVYIDDNIRTNYSLGYENYRNEDYCAALPYLRWVIENEPLFNSQGTPDDRNYRRLGDTYEKLAEMTDDATVRRAYLDSTLTMREAALEALEANNISYNPRAELIKKGLFFAQHYNEYPERQAEIFDLYLEAYRMAPDSTDDYYLNEIGRMVSARAAAEEFDPRDARDLVDELLTHADDPTYLQGIRDTFRLEPIDQWEFVYDKYQDGDREEDTIKPLFVLTVQLDSMIVERRPEVVPRTLRRELLPLVAEYNPTPEILVYLGQVAMNEDRTEEGMTYFERALEATEGNTERRDLYYRIANALYSSGQRSEAYRYAGQALELDSGYGPALYIRALVVAGTLRGGSLANSAGAWCVADMFSRAASAGGDTAAQARRLAGRYAASGPSREDYIFQGWRPGMRVTANTGYGSCSTTVR